MFYLTMELTVSRNLIFLKMSFIICILLKILKFLLSFLHMLLNRRFP